MHVWMVALSIRRRTTDGELLATIKSLIGTNTGP